MYITDRHYLHIYIIHYTYMPSLVLCRQKCIESVRQSLHNGFDVSAR